MAQAVHGEYDVKLMQTNFNGKQNNNKYYIIQVIKQNNQFMCYTRWGRLGSGYSGNLTDPASEGEAIKEFRQKFRQKTKNAWEDRGEFVKHPNKYQLVESINGKDLSGKGDAPLCQLSSDQINKGLAVLNRIKKKIASKKSGKPSYADLSGEYYSNIPTVSISVIKTVASIAEKEKMLKSMRGGKKKPVSKKKRAVKKKPSKKKASKKKKSSKKKSAKKQIKKKKAKRKLSKKKTPKKKAAKRARK